MRCEICRADEGEAPLVADFNARAICAPCMRDFIVLYAEVLHTTPARLHETLLEILREREVS